MPQFTLSYIEGKDKVVRMKVFLEFRNLLDYKNYGNDKLKDATFNQVDKQRYVWFCEPKEE